jgi:hypothetical protein
LGFGGGDNCLYGVEWNSPTLYHDPTGLLVLADPWAANQQSITNQAEVNVPFVEACMDKIDDIIVPVPDAAGNPTFDADGKLIVTSDRGRVTSGLITIPGTDLIGSGPCYHFAAAMVNSINILIAQGATNITVKIREYTVDASKLPKVKHPKTGLMVAPIATAHVIVEVTITDPDGTVHVLLYDCGEPAEYWANIGNASGVVDEGRLNKLTKPGAGLTFDKVVTVKPVKPTIK